MERFVSLLGLGVMIGLGYVFSSNRRKISWKTVGSGVALQLLFGLFILKTEAGAVIFGGARDFFVGVMSYTGEGASFVFGGLADGKKVGFSFATMVLPTIIFISSLMAILYHFGVMQKVIRAMAWVMMKVMNTSGAESLAAAANVFAGQTEAPLVIRPFINSMTRSELMALMTGGMATVAGGVLAAYIGLGIDAGHLLAASVMSAPAALVCAKLMIPETEVSKTRGVVTLELPRTTANVIDAAATGAGEGLKLALNVGAMLLAFIALIAMLNGLFSLVGGWFGYPQLSMELLLGYAFAPISWLLGVPWADAVNVGALLGKKLILNELVAYSDLHVMIDKGLLSERAVVISTYALCGFANFSSIAIQVGGIGSLAPERRGELARLGIRCLIGGTLACFMTACIAGIFL